MRGEDQADRQLVEQLLHLGRGTALFGQTLDRFGGRLAARLGVPHPLAAPQHAHALAVFGQVRQVEEGAERADHHAGFGQRELFDPPLQLGAGLQVGRAAGDGQLANVFDLLERRVAGELTDDFAQGVAQGADFAPQ